MTQFCVERTPTERVAISLDKPPLGHETRRRHVDATHAARAHMLATDLSAISWARRFRNKSHASEREPLAEQYRKLIHGGFPVEGRTD